MYFAAAGIARRRSVSPLAYASPEIAGVPAVTEELTAIAGVWLGVPAPVITRQWKRNGSAIAGATGTAYTLDVADLGASITLTETATNSSGTVSATSNSLGPVVSLSNVLDSLGATVFDNFASLVQGF
jgi:hypothetical protein